MAERADPQLDVCIVAWRSRDVLRACLKSVVGQPQVREVVVVENASGDGTAEMVKSEFPAVLLLANETNVGFAGGNNQAIRACAAPFVLLLNPDTEARAGALRTLLEVFHQEPEVGAVAAQLLLRDGSIQRSCRGFPEPGAVLADALGLARLFPRSRTFGRYRMAYWDHDSRRDVDQPMASAMAVRRAALDDVGLFDEDFPLYFNDVDLCYRLWQAGWRIAFEPRAKVLHEHGASTRQVRPAAIAESHRSLIRFYRKHYRGRARWWGYAAVIAGAWLAMWPRVGLACLRNARRR